VSESQPLPQLEMVWPYRRLTAPPLIDLPHGYSLRSYRPGDETRFYEVMALAGWPGWNDGRLQHWIGRILPYGWFMVIHKATDQIVATAMAVHSHEDNHPFGGELGWVASDPVHKGRGLGKVVCAAVTTRFIHAGYRHIHLYSEDFRLPALKTYLTLGYVPFIYTREMDRRWEMICNQLYWPYTPDEWGY
jgi:mycothiol synthase